MICCVSGSTGWKANSPCCTSRVNQAGVSEQTLHVTGIKVVLHIILNIYYCLDSILDKQSGQHTRSSKYVFSGMKKARNDRRPPKSIPIMFKNQVVPGSRVGNSNLPYEDFTRSGSCCSLGLFLGPPCKTPGPWSSQAFLCKDLVFFGFPRIARTSVISKLFHLKIEHGSNHADSRCVVPRHQEIMV